MNGAGVGDTGSMMNRHKVGGTARNSVQWVGSRNTSRGKGKRNAEEGKGIGDSENMPNRSVARDDM